jgi:hypothetical protein
MAHFLSIGLEHFILKYLHLIQLVIPRALGAGNISGLGLLLAMCAVFVP